METRTRTSVCPSGDMGLGERRCHVEQLQHLWKLLKETRANNSNSNMTENLRRVFSNFKHKKTPTSQNTDARRLSCRTAPTPQIKTKLKTPPLLQTFEPPPHRTGCLAAHTQTPVGGWVFSLGSVSTAGRAVCPWGPESAETLKLTPGGRWLWEGFPPIV